MSEPTPNPVDPRMDPARLQTSMASYRPQLALDRTTLAWVRTALTMASFGFGMVAFFRSIQQQSPSAETIRLHRGPIRMGTALLLPSRHMSDRLQPTRKTRSDIGFRRLIRTKCCPAERHLSGSEGQRG